MVELFSTYSLTYETDRLFIISGLAHLVQKSFQYKYFAGLWGFQFIPKLLRGRIGRADRPSAYRALSWSWITSPGKADLNRLLFGSITIELFSSSKKRLKGYQTVVLENMDVRTMDSNELGQVIHSTLQLSRALIPSYITPLKDCNFKLEVCYEITIQQILLTFPQIPAINWMNPF